MTPRSLAPEYFNPTSITQPVPTLTSDYLNRGLWLVKAKEITSNIAVGSAAGGKTLNLNISLVSATTVAQLTFSNGSYIRVNPASGEDLATVIYNDGTTDTILYDGTNWSQTSIAMPSGDVVVNNISDTNSGWSFGDITVASTPESKIYECNTRTEVEAITDSACWTALKSTRSDGNGLSQILVLPVTDLSLAGAIISADQHTYFTIVISRAFTQEEVSSADFGEFSGVYAWSTDVRAAAKSFSALFNCIGWWVKNGTAVPLDATLSFVIGALLSQVRWTSIQVTRIPYQNGLNELGELEAAFNDRISFALDDQNIGTVLGFLSAGGVAVHAPYVYEDIIYSNQNWVMAFISANKPDFTQANRAVMERYLDRKNKEQYVETGIVTGLDISIQIIEDNWIFDATIDCDPIKALWRMRTNFRIGYIAA